MVNNIEFLMVYLVMKEIWNNLIIAALKTKPSIAIKLNDAATIENIDSLETLIGKKLPQDFMDAYLISDGSVDGSVRLFNGLSLLPIAEIKQLWQAMKEIKASGAFIKDGKEIVADSDEAIKSDWWNEGWLPITDNMSGDYTIIDLAPNDAGTYGQVFQYWHDSSHRTLEATSFKNWIIRTTDNIEKGISKYDEDYDGFIEF
jgi:cell wall assembly regulator SMI1